MPARRLRLPARAGIQLSARPGRYLRLAVADPQIRPAHRRHRLRPGAPAERRRALFRADQSGSGQFRGSRSRAQQDLLRQPHAALSAGAHSPGNDQGKPHRARAGHALPHRQGPARIDRRAAAHRQDHDAAVHRQLDHHESSGNRADRAADRRAARKKSRTCSAR